MPDEELITIDDRHAIGIVRDQANAYRFVLRGERFGVAMSLTTRDMAKLADAILVLSEVDRAEKPWTKEETRAIP